MLSNLAPYDSYDVIGPVLAYFCLSAIAARRISTYSSTEHILPAFYLILNTSVYRPLDWYTITLRSPRNLVRFNGTFLHCYLHLLSHTEFQLYNPLDFIHFMGVHSSCFVERRSLLIVVSWSAIALLYFTLLPLDGYQAFSGINYSNYACNGYDLHAI